MYIHTVVKVHSHVIIFSFIQTVNDQEETENQHLQTIFFFSGSAPFVIQLIQNEKKSAGAGRYKARE
jgi:hypothetical protein